MSKETNVNLVIISATSDNNLRSDIENHLTHSNINVWHTGKIQAGTNRKLVIKAKLENADIIVPLISADFWTDKSRRNELQGFVMPIIRVLMKQKNIRIIPILAKSYPWERTEFRDLDPLPSTGQPIAMGSKRTDDLVKIANTFTDIANSFSPAPIEEDSLETIDDVVPEKTEKKVKKAAKETNVFIVHGHNDNIKVDVQLFIERLGFTSIVLHEQVTLGRTIIEKLEVALKKADYAIVILSADDYGYSKRDGKKAKKSRARQNVVFEMGYFMSFLERGKISILKEDITNFEMIGDTSGIVYVPYSSGNITWKQTIAKEMNAAGLDVDFKKIH